MTSTTAVHHGLHSGDDYGLDAVAKHNAALASTERVPVPQDDSEGLGIFQHFQQSFEDERSHLHSPPTPRSNTASEGVHTRSGRPTRRTDSPLGTDKSRISKSPMSRNKRDRKSKLDRSKTPKLTTPLSVLTRDMSVPVRDMEAWVNRPMEERRKEVEKRNGYVTRPMNSFMLYRSAYAERTKQWCLQNNHQVVSSVSGESWPMEPQEVRDQFDEWAKTERVNHAAAHPEYKFSPSKSINKRRKGEFSDAEDDVSEMDADPDGEYRGPARSVRQRRQEQRQQQQQQQQQQQPQQPPNMQTYGFHSHPYFNEQPTMYEDSQYQFANLGQPIPSNVAFEANGLPFDPSMEHYVHGNASQHSHLYVQDLSGVRVPIPATLSVQQQSIGGYGLPGGQQLTDEDLYSISRTATPMQHFGQSYSQQTYAHHPHAPPYQATAVQAYQQQQQQQQQHSFLAEDQQMLEHARYLQATASSPTRAAVDPSLDAMLAEVPGNAHSLVGENHFKDAIGDMVTGDLTGLPQHFFEECTSPDGTLAPAWNPSEAMQ